VKPFVFLFEIYAENEYKSDVIKADAEQDPNLTATGDPFEISTSRTKEFEEVDGTIDDGEFVSDGTPSLPQILKTLEKIEELVAEKSLEDALLPIILDSVKRCCHHAGHVFEVPEREFWDRERGRGGQILFVQFLSV
jgi:hypothetical protein